MGFEYTKTLTVVSATLPAVQFVHSVFPFPTASCSMSERECRVLKDECRTHLANITSFTVCTARRLCYPALFTLLTAHLCLSLKDTLTRLSTHGGAVPWQTIQRGTVRTVLGHCLWL